MVPNAGGLCGTGAVSGETWSRERLARVCGKAIASMEGDNALYAAMSPSMRRKFDRHLATLKDMEARCRGVTVIIRREGDGKPTLVN